MYLGHLEMNRHDMELALSSVVPDFSQQFLCLTLYNSQACAYIILTKEDWRLAASGVGVGTTGKLWSFCSGEPSSWFYFLMPQLPFSSLDFLFYFLLL